VVSKEVSNGNEDEIMRSGMGSAGRTGTSRMSLRKTLRGICPPLIWQGLGRAVRRYAKRRDRQEQGAAGTTPPGGTGKPRLDVYWSKEFGDVLDSWGEGNAWDEIRLLLAARSGKVLDVACGTGTTVALLSNLPGLEVHGCDISDYLIRRAVDRGIPERRLRVCNITCMDYEDGAFDYAYSVGSLEHLDESGLLKCVAECHRVVKAAAFHQVPVSRSGKDEGWVTRTQSYHNNSEQWWLDKFRTSYAAVYVLRSRWEDDISVGRWFVCVKE